MEEMTRNSDGTAANNSVTNGVLSSCNQQRQQEQPQQQQNIRVLVGTANLGNAKPDKASIAAWIPFDGTMCRQIAHPSVVVDEGGGGGESPPPAPLVYPLILSLDQEDDTHERTSPLTMTRAEELLFSSSSSNRSTTSIEDDASTASLSDSCRRRIQSDEAVSTTNHKLVQNDSEGSDDNDGLMNIESQKEETRPKSGEDDSIKESGHFDIVVIGLQEATFDDDEKDEDDQMIGASALSSNDKVKDNSNVRAKSWRTIISSREPVDGDAGKSFHDCNSLRPQKRASGPQIWGGGSRVLHELLDAQLPSYSRLVSFQRGQMRLEVYSRRAASDQSPPVDVRVLHVAAQNTGRAGLANKGGIVTELLVGGSTRISFLSAHLEAHEGASKFQRRCESLEEILAGTHNQSLSRWHDISHTSHYSFVLGDLNFRTELDPNMPRHSQDRVIQTMIQKQNWYGINRADELHRALRQKLCLAGYHTPLCNFPPTFKTERQRGFHYQEHRRPSYCDRILYKSADQLEDGLTPLTYEPIPEFSTSDHKPVRAAFQIALNQPFYPLPRVHHNHDHGLLAPTRLSSGGDFSTIAMVESMEQTVDRIRLSISDISVDIFDKSAMPPNPYLALISTPEEALRFKTSFWKHLPFVQKSKIKNGVFRRSKGWPTTRRKYSTFSPRWPNQDEISCQIKLHHSDGSPVDLTGAMLHFTVLSFNPTRVAEDSVVGTFSYNMRSLLTKWRDYAADQGPEAEQTARDGLARKSMKSLMRRLSSSSPNGLNHHHHVDTYEIDNLLTKDGREVGWLKCTLETWWTGWDVQE